MTDSTTGIAQDSFRPGRSCPLSYRYPASVFRRAPDFSAETLYVIGGVYGNPEALARILSMAEAEPVAPTLVFNGDFNWFNKSAADFRHINETVLAHAALRGNVETELASDDDAGCGCGYPDNVSDAEVERSNAIQRELRRTALQFPALRERLAALPMQLVAEVGGRRIGIVHGDAESLAGWQFAHDQLDGPHNQAWLLRIFAESGVAAFASSHTCLPALRQFPYGLVINNGAAGMGNFAGNPAGLISRISRHASPHAPRYGAQLAGLFVDALEVAFDQQAWQDRFLTSWPEGSPAHTSYSSRILNGPVYDLARARGKG
jgi:hypothetical protein